jgi:hypothetical protein
MRRASGPRAILADRKRAPRTRYNGKPVDPLLYLPKK